MGKEEPPAALIVKFCKEFYADCVDQTKIAMLLGMSLQLFSKERAAKSAIYAQRIRLAEEIGQETRRLLRDQTYLSRWSRIFAQGIYPEKRTRFDSAIPGMTGRLREINPSSDGVTGSFYSEKCRREICYESGEERRLCMVMEKTDQVR